MGFIKGALTFSLYRVDGDLPAQFRNYFDGRIKKYAYRDFVSSAEEKNVGWTSCKNILDTGFTDADYAVGKYFLFSLRIDRKVIPPSLLKIKYLEAQQQYLAEKEVKNIAKIVRAEIKEMVTLQLMTKVQPVPTFFDVLWSPTENWLLFCSLAEKVRDEFHSLFQDTFQLTALPFVPWDPQFLSGQDIAGIDPLVIGREFLTWLWFKSEERNGAVMMPGIGDVEVIFLKRLLLESGEGEFAEKVVCQGLHTELQEGKEALRRGKKIREAHIKLGRDGADCEFTFKADSFQFQSLKLSSATLNADAEDNDEDGRILERIYLIEQAINTMEDLFRLYLKTRLTDVWATDESARMNKWLQRL